MTNKDPGMRHFYISMVKSGIRIGAGVLLAYGMFFSAGVALVAAEILGIAEEL